LLLLALPIVAVATYFYRRATRTVYRASARACRTLNQNLQENISGMPVVQLNRREATQPGSATPTSTARTVEQENRAVRLETWYGGSWRTSARPAWASSSGSAAAKHCRKREPRQHDPVLAVHRHADPAHRSVVGEQYNVLFRAMASGERIFQALDWDEHDPRAGAAGELPGRLRGEIEFRNLTFGYVPRRAGAEEPVAAASAR
jgi:ATP-binding cassette, subfamily B, multidrug efflux pump